MNENELTTRQTELQKMLNECQTVINQTDAFLTQKKSDLFAIQGAMQNNNFWLQKFKEGAAPNTGVGTAVDVANAKNPLTPVAPPKLPTAALVKNVAKPAVKSQGKAVVKKANNAS